MKRLGLFLGLLLTTFACSEPQGENKAKGKVHVTIKPTGKPASGSLLDVAAADFRNTAVASGAPESLTLYVKSMTLRSEDGVSYTLFYQGGGRGIRVGSKTADISALFTDYACVNAEGVAVEGIEACPCGLDANNQAVAMNADGTCPDTGNSAVGEVQIEEGTFTSMQMEFFVTAKAKGCVSGNFTDVNSSSPSTQGVHTYCTKAAAHTFQSPPGVAAASELEGTLDDAEDMYYQIHPSSSGGQTFIMNFPLQDEVIVEKGADSPRLTVLIDTNRLLRFYNQNQTQAPKTGWPADRSYFFNTVLDESIFVFAGSPGDIRGFQWWTEACADNLTGILCTGTDSVVVSGWMTVIKGPDQEPLAVGLMPDDDDAITLIKGSNKFKGAIDRSAFARREAGYDIGFMLDAEGVGAIGQVNLDADVGFTQTSIFIGLQNYGGKIFLRRSL